MFVAEGPFWPHSIRSRYQSERLLGVDLTRSSRRARNVRYLREAVVFARRCPKLRILALAQDIHTNGAMDDAAYRKITLRDVPKADAATLQPLIGEESAPFVSKPIYMSQTVFARSTSALAMCRSWNGAQSRLPAPRSAARCHSAQGYRGNHLKAA